MTQATQTASFATFVQPEVPARKRVALTPMESTLAGVASGVLEVAVDQPLVSAKNERQKGNKIPRSAKVLYAGFGANAFGMALVTGLQAGVDAFRRDGCKETLLP